VRNSSSSATSGNGSSDGDIGDNNSDAGAVSGGDSPQRATWVAQRDARLPSYPTRGRVKRQESKRERERERERTGTEQLVRPTRVECGEKPRFVAP
jgi:hypothetical protein